MRVLQRILAPTCSVLLLLGSLPSPVFSTRTNSSLEFFTTNDGATYAYDYTPPQGSNATFLFLHGYPASHKDWEHQIAAVTSAGYGALAPDMLGFGASDMPTEPSAYAGKRLAGHLTELLDFNGVDTVIGVGHDWGSAVLSGLAVYHQDRLDKLFWVTVGYQAPVGFFDIDATNANALVEFGYMTYGYWYFFDRYDASTVLTDHLDSAWNLVFPENHTIWVNHLAPVGAARAWLNADTMTADAPFVTEAYKADWMAWMSRPNATEASLNGYRSRLRGVNDADEAELTDEDRTLNVPVFVVGAAKDPVARPEFIEATRPWAKAGFEVEILDSGHWTAMESPDEVNELLLKFAST